MQEKKNATGEQENKLGPEERRRRAAKKGRKKGKKKKQKKKKNPITKDHAVPNIIQSRTTRRRLLVGSPGPRTPPLIALQRLRLNSDLPGFLSLSD